MQAATLVLPVAAPAVVTPGGQDVQLAAPTDDEKEPGAQAVQPPALAVPGLVTAP